MTITVSTNTSVDLERDRAVARVDAKGAVWLWPKGLGEGPVVIFDEHDWDAVAVAVASARKSRDGNGFAPKLDGYTACEGCAVDSDD